MLEACRREEDNTGHYDIRTRYHVVLGTFMFCVIEKVGSTFWSKVLQLFSNLTSTRLRHAVNVVNQDNVTLKALMENMSMNAIFVRDPYEKLISGYWDKLYRPNIFYWWKTGRYIAFDIRVNSSKLSRYCGHDITFSEFIRYFIKTEATRWPRDRHFVTMTEHCTPCSVHYNFIGKMETFQNDANYLLGYLNHQLNVNVKLDDILHEDKIMKVNKLVNQLYDSKGFIIECISFYEAMLRLWGVFQFRGFLGKNISMPFSKEVADTMTKSEFINEIMSAHLSSGGKTYRKQCRDEWIYKAYAMVSPGDMVELTKTLKADCDIFGYDCNPENLLNKNRAYSRQQY